MKKIQDLIHILNLYRDSYYNQGKSTISDKQYDELFDELKSLEESTGIVYSNSPTQSVGYLPRLNGFTKVTHKYPMLSAAKTKEAKGIAKFSNGKSIICSWKLDGCSMQVEYRDGKLYSATTRGNGFIGCDVTEHAKTFVNLPLTIPFTDTLTLRGEAVMSYETFEKVNQKGEFANPRNLVAGTLNQLDVNVCKERQLEFVCFEVLNGVNHRTLRDRFYDVQMMGVEVVSHVLVYDVCDCIESFEKTRIRYNYPTDGLIFRFDDIAYSNSLGSTSHHPNYMMAFKFEDETQETILRNIEWNTSRTGTINPIAIFDEVEIDGTMVGRASLHNVDIIRGLQLGIGDTITVYKANQIIPQIDRNLTCSDTYSLPKICPSCNQEPYLQESGGVTVLRCLNPHCKSQLLAKFTHFVSRDAMNIEGLSEATLDRFINKGWLGFITDIYTLHEHKSEIVKLDGFGTKSYNNLIKAIDRSKHCKLENFIYALGIPNVGKGTAKLLSKTFKTYEGLQKATKSQIKSIDGIGDVMGNSIYNYFHSDDTFADCQFADSLVEFVLEFETDTSTAGSNLDGLVFVVTGSVEKFVNRKELQSKIESLGGKVSGSVSAKTSYLINNDVTSRTGKNKKALELGVKIINEQSFIDMIGGN